MLIAQISVGMTLVISIAGGISVPIVAKLLSRLKSKSENTRTEADAADVLSQGAVRLVPYYESRISSLEARLTVAEAAALLAHQSATAARESEARCLLRLEELQAQINALRAIVEHPPTTTTVTTAVTTQEPPVLPTPTLPA